MSTEIKTKVICPYCETDVLNTGFSTKSKTSFSIDEKGNKEVYTEWDDVNPMKCKKCNQVLELENFEDDILYDVLFSYKSLAEIDIEEQKRLAEENERAKELGMCVISNA